MDTASNEGYAYREQLDERARGLTLLGYLEASYPHGDGPSWRERIERGEVELDGVVVVAPEHPLRPGQRLCWNRPPWREPEVPLHFEVIHEDDDLLVVSKPSGLPTAPAGGFLAHTLLTLVRQRDPLWTPMHRLGRGTSGLVVFARTPEARSSLQAIWRGREVEKRYRALAQGILPAEPFTVDAPIGPVEHPALGTLQAACSTGKPSHSEVRLLAVRGEASLAEVRIATGRPHQIRIHLAFAGHPLVGDPLYGPGGIPWPGTDALPGDLGYHLHAWRLAFAHPRTHRRLELEAEPPAELR
ncbi:MAG: RluA family pseudouridine synthase [Deltaproteobacteria bacterium]|nr:RluA family pseudouridine synthase [Deltaproteobacteria bacterium]